MKNVCFFNSTQFWGGGEKVHLEYAENFHLAGYHVWIICSPGSILEQKAKDKGINYFSIAINNFSFLNPFHKKQLKNFFIENKIDTVFFNASKDLKAGAPAAKRAQVKNIVYMRGLAVPVKNSFLNRYLLQRIVTHIVANSQDTKKALLSKLSKVLKDEQVHVIYRGINFMHWNKLAVSKENFAENGEIILGNVGRIDEQKGQKYLIDIAKILRSKNIKFKLLIAGTGPLEDELRLQIEENKLGNCIQLLGFRSDIKSFLNSIDIFLFPSLWEGFGFALVEAMAEKVVPVAFDLTSNPEIISHGKNGFLIKHPDIDSFADRIEFLITNPEQRQLMANSASEQVRTRFDLPQIVKEWEQLLN